ncbi:hypothetical protein FIM50_07375 [Helicobacter pylori]|nr:hypothetical protein FIM50_07375 [Helicobacter pylori]
MSFKQTFYYKMKSKTMKERFKTLLFKIFEGY